ncbi:MAG TPA: hypothetical protein DEA79_04150, partial [Cyanobacteria bacterium UBA11153]|nr:hypothetical protein [Cyanobacteria bacterium UBA11153]
CATQKKPHPTPHPHEKTFSANPIVAIHFNRLELLAVELILRRVFWFTDNGASYEFKGIGAEIAKVIPIDNRHLAKVNIWL